MTEKVPEVDQDGKMINPHNPDFITKVPWYLGNTGPTLKHHNIQKVDHFLSLSESDQLIQQKIAAQKQLAQVGNKTVYRKGACKNCGAMTHKEKDCVERPRSSKKAAWKTGLDIAPDEVTVNLENHGKVSYSAKRDYWKGYNPADYKDNIDRYDRLEEERLQHKQQLKEQKMKELEEKRKLRKQKKIDRKKVAVEHANKSDSGNSDSDSDYGSDEEDDEDNEGDAKDFIARDEESRDFQGTLIPQGGIGGNGMRVTVRNLRLREDTPKYLRNLDLDSAFYDPKSRSMRLNPLPDENPEDLQFAGDNFVRHSGDALKLAATQVLCWEMQARGESIDAISNPSQAELIQKQFVEKKKLLEESKKKAILEKYLDPEEISTGQSTLDRRLRLGQTEAYTEYSSDGRVIKGAVKPTRRTKYEEDVFINNHTSVWGSYYNRARRSWGYQCCHSLMKNSYCTGEKGKLANDSTNNQSVDSFQARKMLAAQAKEKENDLQDPKTLKTSVFGEGKQAGDRSAFDNNRIQEKIKQQHGEEEVSERKRGFNSMKSTEVTEEDMEIYRMKRVKEDDPMAKLLDSEELLEYK